MYDIITIGDVKLDTFVVLKEGSTQCQVKMPECLLCIEYGAKITVPEVESQLAGSAPNVAVGMSRMKKRTAVISNMGPDMTYELAIKRLKEEKVVTKYIKTVKGEQSAYSVVLNFKGEKTILTKHIHHAYRLPNDLPKAKWLYICEMGSGYELLYRTAATYAKKNGTKLAMNPGTIQIRERKQHLLNLIKRTDILFVNVTEAQTISQEKSDEIHHLAKALWELGATTVVITDGPNGSYSFDGDHVCYCPIYPGKKIEATGAGDAFATGYLAAIMKNETHSEALRWGSVNAASVVSKVGPQKGLLSGTQIAARLKKRPGFKTIRM